MPRDSLARALAAQALAAGGATPAWGSITGTLASQTDLNTALGAKAGGTGTANGTNTGDQTITLTGNVTGSGTGSFATTIAAGAVTLPMQANMATASLVYRKTAGAGAPEVNTLATLKTDLGLTGTNSGDQTITLTSDVTGSGSGSFAATIAAGAVTLAKMANFAANSILGNNTGSGATPLALTAAQVKTLLAITTADVASCGTVTSASVVTANGVSGSVTTSTTTPAITITLGAITPSSVVTSGALTSSSASAGIGYSTGAGGTVTQLTSRTTGVTLSKVCGAITLVSAAGSATWSTFTVTNTTVAATDTVEICQKSGANLYNVIVTAIAAGSFNVSVSAVSGTATESPVFNFVVTKAVTA